MADFDHIVSRTYQPDPQQCCDRCVFGRGQHAPWCEKQPAQDAEDGQNPQ